MRILLATPLYPPDIAEPAPYVKEVAERLSKEHTVSILAYNHIPEEVTGVQTIAVEKNRPVFIRLYNYIRALYLESKKVDIVYIQNGPSVELPFIIVSLFIRTPFILRVGDETALCHAVESWGHKMLLSLAVRRARITITHEESSGYIKHLSPLFISNVIDIPRPHTRPEILPLEPYPHAAFSAYTTSWDEHLSVLSKIFAS